MQKKEHFTYTGDNNIDDFIEGRKKYLNFERSDNFEAKSSVDRKILDEFCQKVNDPIASIKVLYGVGIKTDRTSFSHFYLKNLTNICVAAEPNLEMLNKIGKVANWKKLDWANDRDCNNVVGMLESLADVDNVEDIKKVCTYYIGEPQLYDLPLLLKVAADPRYSRVLSLVRASESDSIEKRFRDINSLKSVDIFMCGSRDVDILLRIQESGLRLDRLDILNFVELSKDHNVDENRSAKTIETMDNLFELETKRSLDPATLWLGRNLDSLMTSSEDDSGYPYDNNLKYSVVGNLQALEGFKGYEKELLAYVSCLKKIYPRTTVHIDFNQVAQVVRDPDRLALALDPEYVRKAAIFYDVFLGAGIRLGSIYEFKEHSKPGLYDYILEYTDSINSDSAKQLIEQFRNNGSFKYNFLDRQRFHMLVELLQIKDINKIVDLVGKAIPNNLTYSDAVEGLEGLKVIADNEHYQKHLEDNRLPEVFTWLSGASFNSGVVFTVDDKPYKGLVGRVIASAEVVGDEDLFAQYSNEDQRDRSLRFADTVIAVENRYRGRQQTISAKVGELLSVTEQDIKTVQAIIDDCPRFGYALKKEYTLAEVQYLSTHTAELEVGHQRLSEVGDNDPRKWDKHLVAIGQADDWPQVVALKAELLPNHRFSSEAAAAIAGDISGFREMYDFYRANGVLEKILDIHSPDRVAYITRVVPYKNQVMEIYNYFKQKGVLLSNAGCEPLIQLAKLDKTSREQIFAGIGVKSSFYKCIDLAAEVAPVFDEIRPMLDLLNKYFPDHQLIDDDPVHTLEYLGSLDDAEKVLAYIAKKDSWPDKNLSFLRVASVVKFLDTKGPATLEKAEALGCRIRDLSLLGKVSAFAERDVDGKLWQAFTACKAKYKISFDEAIEHPDDLLLLAGSLDAAAAYVRVLRSGVVIPMKVAQAEDWDKAGKNMPVLNLMIRAASFSSYNLIKIYEFDKFEPYTKVEGFAAFIEELNIHGNYYFSTNDLDNIHKLLPKRKYLLEVLKEIKEEFPNFRYEVSNINDPYTQLLRRESGEKVKNFLAPIVDRVIKNRKEDPKRAIQLLSDLLGSGALKKNYINELKEIVDLLANDDSEDSKELLAKAYGVFIEINLQFELEKSSSMLVDLFETARKMSGSLREKQILFARIMHTIIASNQYETLDQFGISIDNGEGKAESPGAFVKSFVDRYGVGEKGRTIAVLTAANEYRDADSIETLVQNIIDQLSNYDKILDHYSGQSIPEGLRVSLGMEYEITQSTSKGYGEVIEERDLSTDIRRLNEFSGTGSGYDAVHEIATLPTDNAAAMLLEMQLYQELEFMDFNYRGPSYERGARGYHLTVGGEHGVQADWQINLLQNTLIMSGWAGVNAGKDVKVLSTGRGVNVRQRDYNNVPVFGARTPSVELRALSIDRREPFERTVLASYYSGIAIQAVGKYTKISPKFLGSIQDEFPGSSKALMDELVRQDLLKENIEDDKVVEIIYSWCRFSVNAMKAVEDHNENFLVNEIGGYFNDRGAWVEIDEFGGEKNQSRFEAVIDSIDSRLSMEEYSERLKVKDGSLFQEATPSLANAMTATCNLFLKPSVAAGGDRINSFAMLSVTKLGNKKLEDGLGNEAEKSLFETDGERRQGYYCAQGGSERMIVHATQLSLLQFQREMESILQSRENGQSMLSSA